MIRELKPLVEKMIDKGAVPPQSVIRDAITDLLHIADKKGMDTNEIIYGAKTVFEEERDEVKVYKPE